LAFITNHLLLESKVADATLAPRWCGFTGADTDVFFVGLRCLGVQFADVFVFVFCCRGEEGYDGFEGL
jgi:hypothetical protein